MCRDDLVLSQTGYSVLHIPKSQTTFITSFNDRRTRICGDLRMFFWLFMCNSCSCNWHHWRAGTPKLISHNSCTYTCLIYWRTMPRPGSHKSERFGQNEGALHSGRCPTECHRPGFKFVGKFHWKNWVLNRFWAMFQGEASPRNVHVTKFRGKFMWNFQKKKIRL